MAMWEITITCRDGSRLRFSDQRDSAPEKGDIFDTADTGQIAKARIDVCREEKPNGWGHPSRHGDRNLKSADLCPIAFRCLGPSRTHNDACLIVKDKNGHALAYVS
jgi:hypothetical protein